MHAVFELPLLQRLRADTPAEVDLMVDANGAYSTPRALEVGRELGRLGYRWFEEPLIRTRGGMSYPGYEHLTSLDIAIAGGEGLRGRTAFDDLLNRQAVDIVQLDGASAGGYTEMLKIAAITQAWNLRFAPHAMEHIHSHLVSAAPNGMFLERLAIFEGITGSVYLGAPAVERGYLRIAEEPGLGLTLNMDFIRDNDERG